MTEPIKNNATPNPATQAPEQKQVNTQAVAEAKSALVVFDKTIADKVQNKLTALVEAGRLNLPADYSIGNAMYSAYLRLQRTKDRNGKSVLEACTQDSVANTLFDMATQGLSMAKDQCYPIAYGQELTCFVSVWGKIAIMRRLHGVESDPIANVIYEGDEVEISTESGELAITKHTTSWANVQAGKITGAYASVMFNGVKRWAVVPMREILEAWSKSQADKQHQTFTGEFAKRTAHGRLFKIIAKASTDADLLADLAELNEEQHFDFTPGAVVQTVKRDAIAQTGATPIPERKPATTPEPKTGGITDAQAAAELEKDGQQSLPIEEGPGF